MTLVYLAVAWLAGLVVGQWLWLQGRPGCDAPPWTLWLPIGITLVLTSVAAIQRSALRLPLLLVCVALLGVWRYDQNPLMPCWQADDLPAIVPLLSTKTPVILQGTVISDPEIQPAQVRFNLEADTLITDQGSRPVHGRVLVELSPTRTPQYGDRLRLFGQMKRIDPQSASPYDESLERQGIFVQMQKPQLQQFEPRPDNPIHAFYALLYRIRRNAAAALNRAVPAPEAGVGLAMLLGIRDDISRTLLDAFARAGVRHLISIAGMQIVFLTALLVPFCRRVFGPRVALYPILVLLAVYAVIAGGRPPVLRASIMAALYLIAQQVHRQSVGVVSLAVAGIILTAINPMALWEVDFQMSALTTLGLVLFAQPWIARLKTRLLACPAGKQILDLPAVARIYDTAGLLAVLQVLSFPLVLAEFQQLSLISPFSNLLIWPAQTLVIPLGTLTAVGGMIWQPVGQFFGVGTWLLLAYTVRVVEWCASLPAAAIQLGPAASWVGWSAYMLLLVAGLRTQLRSAIGTAGSKLSDWQRYFPAGAVVLLLLIVSAGSVLYLRGLPDGLLHLTVLDADEADAVLITTPEGHHILLGSAARAQPLLDAMGQALPFWQRTLDLVILTGRDDASVTTLNRVSSQYAVRQVIYPPQLSHSAAIEGWFKSLSEAHVLRKEAGQGTVVNLGPQSRLVAVEGGEPGESAHTTSGAVWRIEYGAIHALLAGRGDDAHLLQDDEPGPVAALLVPWYGRKSPASLALAARISPSLAVFSVPQSGRASYPNEDVWNAYAGALRLRTDKDGSIELISDGRRLWLRS